MTPLVLIAVPSVTVIVSEPIVFNVIEKVPVPEVRVEELGRVA